MRKVLLTQETIYKLQENGIYMTPNNRPADVERRSNKEIFYPDNCTVGVRTGLWSGNKFPNSFGSYSYSFSPLETFFSIGNYCSIAVGLKIMGYRHPMERFTTSSITYDSSCPLFNRQDFHMKKTPVPPPWNDEIKIENDVWIGANVTLKKGITLHTGCVVGANSLVTHDVPPYAVVGGTPAKIIKYRFDSHMIKKLLESRWFDYDVNYLDVPSDIYAYDFIQHFNEHKDELPKFQSVKLEDIFHDLREKRKAVFSQKLSRFKETGGLSLNREDVAENDNYITLLEMLYQRGALGNSKEKMEIMCFNDRWRKMLLHVFLRLETDNRLRFFSMKGDSIWFHYMPFVTQTKNSNLQVPTEKSGKTWPSADRENASIFATYMALRGENVFISIELCAKDFEAAKKMAGYVGYEEKNSPGVIIRLKTKHFPIKSEKDLPQAVNKALDELCKVGDRLTSALNAV